MTTWEPIETAPRDGTWFIALVPITIVGVGKPARASPELKIVQRYRSGPESGGYWRSIWDHSVADSYLSAALWAPLNALPLDELYERVMAKGHLSGPIPEPLGSGV